MCSFYVIFRRYELILIYEEYFKIIKINYLIGMKIKNVVGDLYYRLKIFVYIDMCFFIFIDKEGKFGFMVFGGWCGLSTIVFVGLYVKFLKWW